MGVILDREYVADGPSFVRKIHVAYQDGFVVAHREWEVHTRSFVWVTATERQCVTRDRGGAVLVAAREEPQQRIGYQVVRIGITLVDGHPVLRMRAPVDERHLDVFANVIGTLVRGHVNDIVAAMLDREYVADGPSFVRKIHVAHQDGFVVAHRKWEVHTRSFVWVTATERQCVPRDRGGAVLVAAREKPQQRIGYQVVGIGITLVDGHPVLRMRVPVDERHLDVFANVIATLVRGHVNC
jgi:hypothetical protein